MLRICCAAVVLAMLAVSAFADPPIRKPKIAEALDHLARGNKLYNVRSFEEASVEYKAGALVEPAPIFDYNLGQCYRQLKRYQDAIWHYDRFVKSSPNTPEHVASVQKLIADMKAELDSKAMREPPTDPGPTGETPVPAVVAPNPAEPPPAQPRAAVIPASPAVEPWYADTFGWGLAGVGAVGVVASAGLFVNASGLVDDANHATSQQEQNALRDKADSRKLLGTVIGIGGIALLTTGIIKLAIRPHAEASTGVTHVGVAPSGLVVFGQF